LPSREAAFDPVQVDVAMRRIEQRSREAEEATEAARQRLAAADQELLRMDVAGPPPNLVGLAGDLAALSLRERELERRARGLALAHREIGAAAREYQATFRQHLQASVTGYFAALTAGVAGSRSVRLDESFGVTVARGDGEARGPDGIPAALLSQGAQDQLYVALRLAIADLLAGRVSLPLLFDDPFLTFDASRTAAMRDTFRELGERRQVLLATHRAEFAAWGAAVAPRPLADWPDWGVR
jgi:uncharacterized protein YhaN